MEPLPAVQFLNLQGMGFQYNKSWGGPSWAPSAAGPLVGNDGQPVVIESANGLFDIIAGNQIDFSVSCTTAETVDVALSITYSA